MKEATYFWAAVFSNFSEKTSDSDTASINSYKGSVNVLAQVHKPPKSSRVTSIYRAANFTPQSVFCVTAALLSAQLLCK